MNKKKKVLLSVESLEKEINGKKILNNINFNLKQGTTLGVVGESGSGKTTLAKTIMGFSQPTSGKIVFLNRNIFDASIKDIKELNKNRQMIFQNNYSSLNPKMTIKEIISEPLQLNLNLTKGQMNDKIISLVNDVGLSKEYLYKYPDECSGGERQRVGISRAISLNPKLLICDEPVSSLDMSNQNKILELLYNLKTKYNMTYLFISHDLSVIRKISDQLIIMKEGEIVESGDTEEVFKNHKHQYTQELISSIPKIFT